MTLDVGTHLRAVRTLYGLSQRELAKRAGVTNGLISLIEQNRVSPSVSSLKKVLDGIPMSLAEFFTLDFAASPQVFYKGDELTDLGDRAVSLRLVAARRPNRAMSIIHERYAAGADTGASNSRSAVRPGSSHPATRITSRARSRTASATPAVNRARSSRPARHLRSE